MDASSLQRWALTKAKPQAALLLAPSERHDGAAEVPFPVVDRAAYRAAVGLSNRELNARIEAAPVTTTPVEGLVTPQHTVRPEHVQQYIDDPRTVPLSKGLVPTDVPIIVKTGGVRYIHDGNHRLTARKLLGDTTAEVRYVNLDADRARRAKTDGDCVG